MSDGGVDIPPFLARLGLDTSADQRAIRRAYAREVKKIDQARDAAGFQDLREAYEVALRWEAYQRLHAQEHETGSGHEARAADAAPAPSLAPAPAPEPAPDHDKTADAMPPSETIDPDQLSADVFDALMAGCSGLAQGRTLHDCALWEQHLRHCLADERLMNLAARGIFEARIVHLLASGWRCGHETLLEAAADVFQWRGDRHRLLQFGHAGAILDRAIDERAMFDNQHAEEQAAQRQVVARLRETDAPDWRQLRLDMPHAEQLAARFPTWLELVVSMENLQCWRAAYAALPPEQRPQRFTVNDEALAASLPPAPKWWQRIPRMVVILVVIGVLRNLANLAIDHGPGAPDVPAAPPRIMDNRKLDAEYDALQRKYAAVRAEREKNAAANPAGSPAEQRQGTPAPDQALEAGPQRAPKALPPSRERIDEIGGRIRYRMTHAEKPGKYRAEFDVSLDGQGRVAQVRLHRSSGLAGYDAAVERAIREAEAFPAGTLPAFRLLYGMEIVARQAPQEKADEGAAGPN